MPTGKRLTPSLEYLSERFPKDNAPVVLFDPGHGGMIDGVYQTDKRFDINKPGSYTKGYVHSMGVGIAEGEFNRDIMNRVCKYMDMVGLPYKKIVDTEEDVPLRKRSDDINEYYYNENKRCFVCSIHANAGKGTGKEIFTSPGETNADPMAEIMILRMDDDLPELRLRADKSDGDHDKEAKFWDMETLSLPRTWNNSGRAFQGLASSTSCSSSLFMDSSPLDVGESCHNSRHTHINALE